MEYRVKLRALTYADMNKTHYWHNETDISDLFLKHPFPVNIETEKLWYDQILYSNFPTNVFGIEFIETAELIGLTLLKDINLLNRTTEYAIYIGDVNYRGIGLAKEATTLTLNFAFNKLGLNRVFLKVLEDNLVAHNLYKKLGLKTEGVCRETIFKNNKFHNEILMSVLKKEYMQII